MEWDPSSIILWLDENEGVLSAIAAIVVIAGLLFRPVQSLLTRRSKDPAPAAEPVPEAAARTAPNPAQSLWVPPFEAIGSEADAATFARGLSDDVASALKRISGVRVLLDERDADQVVSGSLAIHGDAIRVVARLHDPASGELLWSRDFDLERDGFFRVQREIAAGIVGEVGGEMQMRAFQAMNLIGTDSTDAWALSQHSANMVIQRRGGATTWADALEAAERAVEIDPDFAAAHGRIAALRSERPRNFVSPDVNEDHAKALEAAERATQLGTADPYVLMNCGQAWTQCGERRRGREALTRARSAVPDDALCQVFMMMNITATGTDDERREALEQARSMIERFPNHPVVHMYWGAQGMLSARIGDHDGAIDALRECYQIAPGIPGFAVQLARMLFTRGDADAVSEAQLIVRRLRADGFTLTQDYVRSLGRPQHVDEDLLALLASCDAA